MSPERDEVEVLADAIRCSADQALKLRRRLVAQRAARTFSLEHGEFVLDDRIALPVVGEVSIDHRHAIYLGVRTNLSEQRLIDDLRQLVRREREVVQGSDVLLELVHRGGADDQ